MSVKLIREVIRNEFVTYPNLISILWAAVYLKISQTNKYTSLAPPVTSSWFAITNPLFFSTQSNHRSQKSSQCLCFKQLMITELSKTRKKQDLLSLKVLKRSLDFFLLHHVFPVDCWPPCFIQGRKLSPVPTAGAWKSSHSTADVNINGQGSWSELLHWACESKWYSMAGYSTNVCVWPLDFSSVLNYKNINTTLTLYWFKAKGCPRGVPIPQTD